MAPMALVVVRLERLPTINHSVAFLIRKKVSRPGNILDINLFFFINVLSLLVNNLSQFLFYSAVGRAITQAQAILMHPQEALRADRESARHSFFASSLEDALRKERKRGMKALEVSRTNT